MQAGDAFKVLTKYGTLGQNALANATPTRSGKTAGAWDFVVQQSPTYFSIKWTNHNVNEGRPIAILIEYGHGTGTGGYVAPHPFIMGALEPIFAQMAAEAWREVNSL